MPDHTSNTQANETQTDQLDSIKTWLSNNVEGEIVNVERLMRWRPVWRVDYKTNGENKALLLKGVRPCTQLYSLKHEMLVMEVLEANGIDVPHIHGWIESPEAFVMDWAEGDRDPGLIHTAIDNASTISPERWQASLKYMEALAKMHEIPVAEFSKTEAGNPQGANDVALSQFERQYALGLEVNAVDANMAFFASWLRRNVPQHRTKASFITGDCGQFMSQGEDITGIIDLEIAHIGDIFMDLACFRGRHPYENMGDIPALYRHYSSVSGVELDLPVIAYHTVCFLGFAAIAAIMFMDPKKPQSNWIEGILELASISRRALEAMAELESIELDYDISLPEAHDTPIENMAIEKLLLEISHLPLSNTFPDWQRDLLSAIPKYLLNHAHYGRWYEEETLREIGELTGARPVSLSAAETELKAFIQAADASMDTALIKLFHRRMLRLSMIISGSNPSDENPLFFKLEPILTMTV
jgi:aminoglycoside phosphotransferase (APT) family kinase protein